MINHELDEHQKAVIAKKKAELYREAEPDVVPLDDGAGGTDAKSGFSEHAQRCIKCNVKATARMANCIICLNCGESRCG